MPSGIFTWFSKAYIYIYIFIFLGNTVPTKYLKNRWFLSGCTIEDPGLFKPRFGPLSRTQKWTWAVTKGLSLYLTVIGTVPLAETFYSRNCPFIWVVIGTVPLAETIYGRNCPFIWVVIGTVPLAETIYSRNCPFSWDTQGNVPLSEPS